MFNKSSRLISITSILIIMGFSVFSFGPCLAETFVQGNVPQAYSNPNVNPFYKNIPTMNGNPLHPYKANPYFNHNNGNPYFRR